MKNKVNKFDCKRETWIDIIKGFCIINVVLWHLNTPLYFITSFFVPIFYFISGYNFKIHNKHFLNAIKSMYFPFIRANLVIIIMHNIFYKLNIFDYKYIKIDYIIGIKKVLLFDYFDSLSAPLWFLLSLFLLNLYFFISHKLLKNILKEKKVYKIMGIICLAFYILAFLDSKIFNKVYYSNYAIITVFCFSLIPFFIGLIFKKENIIKKIQENEKIYYMIFFIISVIFIFISCHYKFFMDLRIGYFFTNNVGFIISLIGIFWIIILSKIIEKSNFLKKLLSYIGKNSLYIMLYHTLSFQFYSLFQIHLFKRKFAPTIFWDNIMIENQLDYIILFICGIFIPIILKKVSNTLTNRCKKYVNMIL